MFEFSHKLALVQGGVNLTSIELNAVQNAFVADNDYVMHNFGSYDYMEVSNSVADAAKSLSVMKFEFSEVEITPTSTGVL